MNKKEKDWLKGWVFRVLKGGGNIRIIDKVLTKIGYLVKFKSISFTRD
jgi:hypothetical protein